MNIQVPFINRETELALIDTLINERETSRIVCLQATGGIGKTRFLQEIQHRYSNMKYADFIVTEIIDFDDSRFHLLENLGYKVAEMIGKNIFTPYLQELLNSRKFKITGSNSQQSAEAFLAANLKFLRCFNTISACKRVILFCDTTDALADRVLADYIAYFSYMGLLLKNTLIFITGRNAGEIGSTLRENLGEKVQIIELPPLPKNADKQYLQAKQKLLHIRLEPELTDKLVILAKGKPMLLDLAAEWRTRGITLDWLLTSQNEQLQTLSTEQQQEFERQLVIHIAQMRSQIDWLILLLARIYPLDQDMLAALGELSAEQAKHLFEEAKTYVFVKCLPDQRITLHDEMRRMVNAYVCPEVDPECHRQESERIIQYLTCKIESLTKQIVELERLSQERQDIEAELLVFVEHEALIQERWILKKQHLHHTFFIDHEAGIRTFRELCDEYTKTCQFPMRDELFTQMQKYVEKLSPQQQYTVKSREIKHLIEMGKYSEAQTLATTLLDSSTLLPIQRVEIRILRANSAIRFGLVKQGIGDFQEAVKVSENEQLPVWLVKAQNGLGWGYLLIGDHKNATTYLHKAQRLYLSQSERERKELQQDYGWISNNLAFVLSDDSKKRQTAIGMARETIKHWQSIGNTIGLGACYLVLGIAYYRSASRDLALDAFQKALDIFKPLKLNEWLGQIYSWRGALYQDMKKFDAAISDLKGSLDIGATNRSAMTLNRLGRVYISLQEWDIAERYLLQSLDRAQRIPDYRYWLGSVARLAMVAAEKRQYHRLEEFEQLIADCLKKTETPDKNALGFAYLELAKLAFGKNQPDKINKIVVFLKEGISLMAEYGSYVRTDVLKILEFVEKDFYKVNPEIICSVGQALQKYTSEKEMEDITYSAITQIMYRWANWRREENSNEK